MLKRLSTLALTLAFATPLASARAGTTASWDVCGGNFGSSFTYAFCASVQVSVSQNSSMTGYTVAMTVTNLSGQNGSDPLAVFDDIGLDNVPTGLALLSDPSVTVFQNGSPVCPTDTCWQVATNQGTAGGFKIDFLPNTSSGNTDGLATCASGVPAKTLGACAGHAVTISFDVNNSFDPSTTNLYIKGQNGPAGFNSTECITGGSTTELCTNVTTTPEPATMGLMATGLFGLIPVYRRRRNNGEPIEG